MSDKDKITPAISIRSIPVLEVAHSINKLAAKSKKDVEIKILFEARDAETNEFIGYGEPVWMTIEK